MSDDKVDPIVRARQQACGRHPGSIIRQIADAVARCPFCGVSQGDWEAMEQEMQWATAAPSNWQGHTYNGVP